MKSWVKGKCQSGHMWVVSTPIGFQTIRLVDHKTNYRGKKGKILWNSDVERSKNRIIEVMEGTLSQTVSNYPCYSVLHSWFISKLKIYPWRWSTVLCCWWRSWNLRLTVYLETWKSLVMIAAEACPKWDQRKDEKRKGRQV
jgi:hypothetical protein